MAGTNNFLQHNPNATNQESDVAYASDNIRTSGVGVDQTLPSPWLNKIWYQCTTFVAAFGQMMANKGFSMSDADINVLQSQLANIFTTHDMKIPVVEVGWSPTPTFPASTANGFDITLAGNVTSSSFDVAPSVGTVLTFIVQQGSGAFTFVPPAVVNGWQPINQVPNSVTVQQFVVRTNGTIWPVEPIITAVNTNVTGNRTFNAVYQNTSGTPMFVTVSAEVGSGGAVMYAYCDGSPNPNTLMAATSRVAASNSDPIYPLSLSFFVPNGSYYSLTQNGGNTGAFNLTTWIETAIV